MKLLEQPVAGAEFVALDTETNGLGGELCEITEVGAVLVGGGELHETYDSLVRPERPLSRGHRALHRHHPGDGGRRAHAGRGAAGGGRAARGPRAGRAQRATSTAACSGRRSSAPASTGRAPPALCTVRSRGGSPRWRAGAALAPLAEALGIEVNEVHRALPDALTCARVFCALFPRLCANAVTVAEALDLLRSRRRARKTEPAERIPPSERPDLSTLPDDPGVYVFRDDRGRPLYVGKSVSLRSRARAHFCAPAGWTERAEIVDYRPTNSELGALVLENRLIKDWQPAGNRKLKRTDRHVFLRCRLDIPYPVLEVAAAPAGGNAVNVGPLGSTALAAELADQLTSLYRLRHCGRTLHAAREPVRLRADGPLRVAVPGGPRSRTPTGASWTWRSGCSRAPSRAGGCSSEIDRRIAEASADQRYERAAALLRRRGRLAWVLERLEGILRATHAAPRLMLARHPVKPRFDAFWIVRGRLADWGPLPGHSELVERTAGRAGTARRAVRGAGAGGRGGRAAHRVGLAGRQRAAGAAARPRPGRRCASELRGRGGLAAVRGPLARRLEPDPLVGLVAERLGGRCAAAAQDDRLAVLARGRTRCRRRRSAGSAQ